MGNDSYLKAFIHFLSSKVLHRQHRQLQRQSSKSHTRQVETQSTCRLVDRISNNQYSESSSTLIFNMEEVLLRTTSSLFPYFMLVAFEAGGLIRALVLFLLYPLICLVGRGFGLKIMVMVCFFGIKKDGFMAGSAVLPKFFLEDVGLEGFELVRKFKRKVGVSDMPQVMVESFLRDYMEIDHVVGRGLKVCRGYFIGVMEENSKKKNTSSIDQLSKEFNVIGFHGSKNCLDHQLVSICKETYSINEAEKVNWSALPKEMYPKPLIFHDGRLATKPTLEATFAILMWAPLGFTLALLRLVIALSFPIPIAIPILTFTGIHLLTNKPPSTLTQTNLTFKTRHENNTKGNLYACNHKTLLDPICLSLCLGKPLTAVTYSLSRVSEILSPIKTIRMSRSRDQDAMMMDKMLQQGDLVVCPEGTTCREPYLLRFSPLFAEMSDEIVPVAMDCCVSMFYGTTAGGLKCFDPLFFLMNPQPSYTVRLLQKVQGSSMCNMEGEGEDRTRFDVANLVQAEMGKALEFECTRLTRKDKYLILAGNEGVCRD